LHFLDPKDDSPPQTCGYNPATDCSDGECAVGAVHNYTTRVLDHSLSQEERSIAIKFLIHVIGDLHQVRSFNLAVACHWS
jgi:S1/P1 Nuclease